MQKVQPKNDFESKKAVEESRILIEQQKKSSTPRKTTHALISSRKSIKEGIIDITSDEENEKAATQQQSPQAVEPQQKFADPSKTQKGQKLIDPPQIHLEQQSVEKATSINRLGEVQRHLLVE